jgi:membrane protein
MLTLISAFPVFAGLGEHIHRFLLANMLPDKAGTVVSAYIEQFSGRAGRLTALGTAFLAVTAFMMMFTMERAFNSIWRVSRPRPLAQRILVYWAALTLGPVLIGASLSITSYLVGASLGIAHETPLAGTAILWLVPFVLTWAAFTLVYYFVPNRAIRPRHALIGGLVAAFVFEIMKRSFAVFVAQIPTYTLVYGAFAVVPIFLLWIYFSWVVVVIGALITALAPDFAVLGDKAASTKSAGFGDALATLVVLAQAQQGSEVLELRKIARGASLTVDQAERLLERMAARGWVARSGREKYAMVCDKERLLVGDVYREFVLDGSGRTRGDALDGLMARLAARAEEALSLPLGRLIEGRP